MVQKLVSKNHITSLVLVAKMVTLGIYVSPHMALQLKMTQHAFEHYQLF